MTAETEAIQTATQRACRPLMAVGGGVLAAIIVFSSTAARADAAQQQRLRLAWPTTEEAHVMHRSQVRRTDWGWAHPHESTGMMTLRCEPRRKLLIVPNGGTVRGSTFSLSLSRVSHLRPRLAHHASSATVLQDLECWTSHVPDDGAGTPPATTGIEDGEDEHHHAR